MSSVHQAAGVSLPTGTATKSVPSGAAIGTAIDLADYLYGYVTCKVDSEVTIRAGSASTVSATSGDWSLEADREYSFGPLSRNERYLSVYGSGAAASFRYYRSSR